MSDWAVFLFFRSQSRVVYEQESANWVEKMFGCARRKVVKLSFAGCFEAMGAEVQLIPLLMPGYIFEMEAYSRIFCRNEWE